MVWGMPLYNHGSCVGFVADSIRIVESWLADASENQPNGLNLDSRDEPRPRCNLSQSYSTVALVLACSLEFDNDQAILSAHESHLAHSYYCSATCTRVRSSRGSSTAETSFLTVASEPTEGATIGAGTRIDERATHWHLCELKEAFFPPPHNCARPTLHVSRSLYGV